MKWDRFILNGSSFLAGCFPIALIQFIQVFVLSEKEQIVYVAWFSKIFLIVTIIAAFVFYMRLKNYFAAADTRVYIENLKRKDMFSSGAISYYVLPFVSFLGDTIQSAATLSVLIILLLIIFNNNMMFMYTPMLDILGYKVLEGTMKSFDTGTERKCNIVVKTDRGLFFTGSNLGMEKQINEDTVLFVRCSE